MKTLNLSYDVPLDDYPIIKSGTYNEDNCGGPCDWCVSNSRLGGALISLPYNDEKYLYVFSFYGEVEGDLLRFIVENLKMKHLSKMGEINEFVYLCNEKLPEYDEFVDGVIYFAEL